MKKIILSAVAFAILSVVACKKDNSVAIDAAEMIAISSEDLSNAESSTQSSEDELDETLDENGLKVRGDCPKVTLSAPKGTFPQTATLTFEGDCKDRNGRTRKGQIVVTVTDSTMKTGAKKTVVYKAFMLDSLTFDGIRTWTNTGKNAAGQPTFTRTVENAKITHPDRTVATWSASHTVTKTKGFDTPKIFIDDEFSVTGGASGVNRKGVAFTSAITTPLVHQANCPWILSGVRSFTVGDRTFSLDYGYGGGSCDNKAELTLANGLTKVITLRR